VVIQVVDNGEGIAPEDVSRLFTPFFRADRSRARATGGVGLGLALSRRIVEAHGGTLVADSAPGRGTTMTITLPSHAVPRP
jgi:signal transduction histidine kinase